MLPDEFYNCVCVYTLKLIFYFSKGIDIKFAKYNALKRNIQNIQDYFNFFYVKKVMFFRNETSNSSSHFGVFR